MARLRGALLPLLVLGAACAPPTRPPPPEVEYAGCQGVLFPGPVCVLPESRKLQIWAGAPPDAGLEVRVDGRRFDFAAETIRNGQGFSLVLPAGAARVDVLAAAPERHVAWSLSLAQPGGPVPAGKRDLLYEINEQSLLAYTLIRQRDLAAARKILDGLPHDPGLPAEARVYPSCYRGQLAEKEEDYRLALAETRKCVQIAERVKLDRLERMAEEQMALILRRIGRSREAAHIFERLGVPSGSPCEAGRFLTNQGWSALLAREAGESLADPTPLLERALASYESCENVQLEKKVNGLINLVLAHLQEGRLVQAKSLLARVHRLEPHPPLPHRLWRLDLEARIELREGRLAQALRRFEELEALAEETSSPDARLRAAFGQARCHRDLGETEAALAVLRRVEELLDEQSLQIPLDQGREHFVATRQAAISLHIEILFDRGSYDEAMAVARRARSRMLRQLERSDRLASLSAEERMQWESRLAEFQAKRAALEERARNDWRLSPAQLGHERIARRAEAEAAQKLLDEAFQILGGREERPDDGRLPPLPGELLLVYHPLSGGEWVGFAADGETVVPHRFRLPPAIPSSPTPELGRLLLHPFRAAIRKADRIRILACGPLQGVDFHALPFGGDVLLARAPVVYGLDLPVSARSARAPGRRALVVADSRGDLPGALAEGRTIVKALRSGPRPWIAEELKGEEASPEAVREQLAAADLLHYAGHSSYSGFGGWESSLLLAADTRLTLGELLALDNRVPAWVVLSGCESGRSSADVPVEGLGLAQAFLLAGSRGVVASVRPAYDRAVPELFTELYRHWGRTDPASALQRAQLSWRERNPGVDWAGFRLFEP